MQSELNSVAVQDEIEANDAPILTPPPSSEVTAAAMFLGKRPKEKFHGRRRHRRVWTGFVEGQRAWVGREVVLPDRRVALLESACRNHAIIQINENRADGLNSRYSVQTRLLRLYKLPAAIVLGQQKLGVIETKSAKKVEACRKNGSLPVRPGHRRRGRPRKNAPDWQRYVLKTKHISRENMSIDQMILVVVRLRAELDEVIKMAAAKDAEKARRDAIKKMHVEMHSES